MDHAGHSHIKEDSARLKLALGTTATLVVAEFVGGIASNSMKVVGAGRRKTSPSSSTPASSPPWSSRANSNSRKITVR